MRSANDLESFLQKWQVALRSPSKVWEGRLAVAELRSAGYTFKSKLSPEDNERISMFDFVLCRSRHGWRPKEMLGKILAEVEDYKKQKRIWKAQYPETEVFLAGIERRV